MLSITMTSSPTQRDVLLQQIAREQRELRILESERALLLSRLSRRRSQGAGWVRDAANTSTSTSTSAGNRNSKKRPCPRYHGGGDVDGDQVPRLPHDSADKGDERDLLDVLDALQCRATLESMKANNTSAGANQQHQQEALSLSPGVMLKPDDAAVNNGLREVGVDSNRLHPILGGIAFTGVKGPLPPSHDDRSRCGTNIEKSKESNGQQRLYILSGHTSANLFAGVGSESNSECCCIGFEVRAEISFADRSDDTGDHRATVSSVHTKFFPHPSDVGGQDDHPQFALPFPKEELEELADLISRTLSLTQLFRELVAFHEFHQQRSASMERLVEEFGNDDCLSITCADMMEITCHNSKKVEAGGACLFEDASAGKRPLLRLRLSWSRSFSELGREDDLCVEDCAVGGGREAAPGDVGELVDTILDPDGIDSLVHIAGGIEEAIRAILRAVTGT